MGCFAFYSQNWPCSCHTGVVTAVAFYDAFPVLAFRKYCGLAAEWAAPEMKSPGRLLEAEGERGSDQTGGSGIESPCFFLHALRFVWLSYIMLGNPWNGASAGQERGERNINGFTLLSPHCLGSAHFAVKSIEYHPCLAVILH